MAILQKIDSNQTGLRIAEEASLGVLPGTPVWEPYEPNEYADFGGEVTTVARAPINADRKRKKGLKVDEEASWGFQTDVTQVNLQKILQGQFWADMRLKTETGTTLLQTAGAIANVDGTNDEYDLTALAVSAVVGAGGTGYAVNDVLTLSGGTGTAPTFTVTAVSSGVVTAVSLTTAGALTAVPSNPAATTGGGGTGCTLTVTYDTDSFAVGDLIFATNHTNAQNNGLKRITSASTTIIGVAEDLVDETPPAAAGIVTVGFQFGAGDFDATAASGGNLPTYTTSTKDLTELGLVPGEWIYVGGDSATLRLTATDASSNQVNNGRKRVRSIAANTLTIDKSDFAIQTEASTTETVQIFFGRVLKDETGTLIKRRTYQAERTLGAPDDSLLSEIQAQYEIGSVGNEFVFNYNTADKLTADLSFLALRDVPQASTVALKSGTRPAISVADAFNTSTDVKRVALSKVVAGDENPTPLFAIVEEFTLSFANNPSLAKGIGVTGAFEVVAGDFVTSGELTAYFQNIEAQNAVRNVDDVSLDVHLYRSNAGIAYDLPLITLGDGRANVVKDEAIKIPLGLDAAEGTKVDSAYTHTAMMCFFDYLPTLADTV